ncbi:MAG TPA: hypothetical protein VGL03_14665 [Thermoanaerobaculia bacterium]|jgi:hypothetical protein
MPKRRRRSVLKGEEVKWLLKKHPQLRRTLKKLRLKLTLEGRILALYKAGCPPEDWTRGKLPSDPLIARTRKSRR